MQRRAIRVPVHVHCHYERCLYATSEIYDVRQSANEFTIVHKRGVIVISCASWRRHLQPWEIQKRRLALIAQRPDL
jgi:hypothetical protein